MKSNSDHSLILTDLEKIAGNPMKTVFNFLLLLVLLGCGKLYENKETNIMTNSNQEKFSPEIVICIPGLWKNRTDFVGLVASQTKGDYLFAGGILANPKANDHVLLEFCEPFEDMRYSFEIAGQGKLPNENLDQIAKHNSVVYLRFPLNVTIHRKQILKYTSLLRDLGGLAVKVETTGIAHTWDVWQELLSSENLFDLYRCFVVLIGDEKMFYSCGMHHFQLPDCQISREISIEEAADIMNRFNYYQITEKPKLESGNTFSLTPESPHYLLTLEADPRHDNGSIFWNLNGLWTLEKVL